MGMPHIRQFMKEGSRTVNGFKTRDIIFFDPHCINECLHAIRKDEVKDIFRMIIADGQTESRLACQSVEDNIPVGKMRSDFKENIVTIIACCCNR